jgi:Zn-finger nucleic acid-binding protein
MKEVERLGVSIDICPGCKGVWLDRGELEKLIAVGQQAERSATLVSVDTQRGESGFGVLDRDGRGAGFLGHRDDHDHNRRHGHDHGRERYSSGEHDREHGQSQHRRRGSWLADIFGGDD